ncbi:MAG: bifunctional proline dehydrogenase/L-glutamate gamma-semialdehyde dehydrogenase PutA [Pseudomonadota bacterium]
MARDHMTDFNFDIDGGTYADQSDVLRELVAQVGLTTSERAEISAAAANLVRRIRQTTAPGLMEVFLAEYGLSTDEGIALMCLAEALLRVPDADTVDALIEDKIAPSDWGRHLGHSTSSLVNASTWALLLTGRVLEEGAPGPIGHLRAAVKRMGEPVIRRAVSRAMKEMGRQFVLGETISSAMARAAKMEEKGYTYSYDMLGEAARTQTDADRYFDSYSNAIAAISAACNSGDIRQNPGISVKLSALHPRYEVSQRARVMDELVPRLRDLAVKAKTAGMGFNVDAEEADRLSLSLEIIDQVLADSAFAGWNGFGVVVQAYGPRAGRVIDTLYRMSQRHDRKIMVRLVKGAYWDTEIKRAQVEGVAGFPVFTSKPATDVSYIANAAKLLRMTDRIYPQFATHNAHTVAAILHLANDPGSYEFQRLHGMGETLHGLAMQDNSTRCRIYAPVGAHKDLLAYLVRRLLENGANSSFVNQIVDETVPAERVAADPFDQLAKENGPEFPSGPALFAPARMNSCGFDLSHGPTLTKIDAARSPFRLHLWKAAPLLADEPAAPAGNAIEIRNPAEPGDLVGTVTEATLENVTCALEAARNWDAPVPERRVILQRAADLMEARYGEIFALLAREAGKNLPDAVAELREAVDFLRYYATQATGAPPAGTFTCISPWNFPMAIFCGQVTAALAAGNAVLAKPAEQTPLIAHLAVSLLHEAGVPRTALQLLPGGGTIGAALVEDPRVGGVAFTGSTETALKIRAGMARACAPGTPLIAETGGLNAMIVDSTALPEQAVQSIIESAFQSAGQRCSALRCLYVQEDIAPAFIEMLTGAMQALTIGTPWHLATDVGPVIDADAQEMIVQHIETARQDGRLLAEVRTPLAGHFVAPTILRIDNIRTLEREIFGPVLHVGTFKSNDLEDLIDDINGTGYGLTFGLHTRIDDRVQHICERIKAGNIYVNRNQIGAIVGSQPFGGEGLSGTGPKAGGPNYLARFAAPDCQHSEEQWTHITSALPSLPRSRTKPIGSAVTLPGPTGESNRLSLHPRPALLCLGPGPATAQKQKRAVERLGGQAVVCEGGIDPAGLSTGPAFGGVLWWGDAETALAIQRALAARQGPILPLITGLPDTTRVQAERHICVDTTASGGNAALLGAVS